MRGVALAVGLVILALLRPPGVAGQSRTAAGTPSETPPAAQSARERLQGAWQVMDLAAGAGVDGTDDAVRPGPDWWAPPGLLLFAGDHYSYTLVTRPRPEMPRGIASSTDLLEVWSPFTANAGTFEVAGDTLTRRPMVAKNPDAMGAGVFNRYTFRMRGDTLWITTVGTETGPARNPTTVRYQRLPRPD